MIAVRMGGFSFAREVAHVDMLAYIRRACMRHDTAIAMAFRRALGTDMPERMPDTRRAHASAGVYAGMRECFANRKRVNL